MAQNSIEIFDDTVLKLTVNQGTEKERSITTVGNFTMGELAFVRDTGRLFIGDCSDDETIPVKTESGEINYTKGGVLAGNRYLGIIDSKPLAESPNEGAGNGTPLNFETTTESINSLKEKPMIGSYKSEIANLAEGESKFKKEMVVDGDTEGQKTAYRWNRNAEYNEQYDAYNGDIVYDVYNNAIILFDKNITPDVYKQTNILDEATHNPYVIDNRQVFMDDNGAWITDDIGKVNVKRRTPILNLESSRNLPIYGEGYVMFRNVEPDNNTIEFIHKEFDVSTGKSITNAGYSHNVLAIKNIPFDKIYNNFNKNQFNIEGESETISIKDNLDWVNEIGTSADVSSLKIPDKLTIKHIDSDDSITFKKIDKEGIAYIKQNAEGYTITTSDAPTYSFKLGRGLTSSNGKQVDLTQDSIPVISLDGSVLDDVGYVDPFWIEENSITPILGSDTFTYANQYTLHNGLIAKYEEYDSVYSENAEEWIGKYQSNKNISTNFLKTPLALVWTTASGSTGSFSVNTEFYNGDYMFCLNGKIYSKTSESSSTSIKIFANGTETDEKAPLDINSASISEDVKNAYRYYSLVQYEMDEDEITPKSIKTNTKAFKIFEWQCDGDSTIINAAYTPDGLSSSVDEIKIGNLLVWKNNEPCQPAFNNFNTIVVDSSNDGTTIYSIYADANDLIQNVYHKITYSLVSQSSETTILKSVDLIKKGYVKFIESLQLAIENGRYFVGPNKQYEVSKFYESAIDGNLVHFIPNTEEDILSKHSIVLAIIEEEYDTPRFLFYKPITCDKLTTYKTKKVANDYKIRIPMHAKNALIEVTVYNASANEKIGVFTANKFSDLKTSFSGEDTPYTHVSSAEQPTIHTTGMLNAGENEVALASIESSRYTNLFEVPIHHDEITNKPYFVLRVGNVNPGSHFIAKLVGYTL